jgi:hypothetical protein
MNVQFRHSSMVSIALALLPQLLLAQFAAAQAAQATKIETDVLLIGGGTSGMTAGIQAARLGARTLVCEETPWLGGMLTAAGVAAIDGNNKLPSGLWGEFRQKLRDHYGGASKVETGWVSNTLFEPHVGDSIWKVMVRAEPMLAAVHGVRVVNVLKDGKRVVGAVFQTASTMMKRTITTATLTVRAKVVIDATELGDVLALAGAAFDMGMESRAVSGEKMAPAKANTIIQDLTWVAVLQDYGTGADRTTDRTIPRPANYDPKEFNGCCKESCYDGISPDSAAKLVDAQKMLDYARLPVTSGGAKYMLNWPRMGNDYYLNAIPLSHETRLRAYEQAKQRTLRFVYHIQHTLGFKHLGLAAEFPTTDSLALMPYHREARRVQGVVRMNVNHILQPNNYALYRTAIAVGDYPIDHHHAKNPNAPSIDFPPVPSFSVPLGALLPRDAAKQRVEGLIVAEKSISVSNLANGTTRLQPCVMLIGQAAGALAGLAVKNNIPPNQVSVRSVQQILLDATCWLLPFLDVPPEHPQFQAIQKVALVGALRGTGVPYKWANQTWFYPDSSMSVRELITAVVVASGKARDKILNDRTGSARIEMANTAMEIRTERGNEASKPATVRDMWQAMATLSTGFTQERDALKKEFPDDEKTLTRKEIAYILHMVFHPFDRIPIDLQGIILSPQRFSPTRRKR